MPPDGSRGNAPSGFGPDMGEVLLPRNGSCAQAGFFPGFTSLIAQSGPEKRQAVP
jgi:hypothetical protein